MENVISTQQFRRSTGEFTNKQDKAHGNPRQEKNKIKKIINNPGHHRGNIDKKEFANAVLNFVTLVSTMQPTPGYAGTRSVASDAQPLQGNKTDVTAQFNATSPYPLMRNKPEAVSFLPTLNTNNHQERVKRSLHIHSHHHSETSQPAAFATSSNNHTQTVQSDTVTVRQLLEAFYQEANNRLDELLAKNQLTPPNAHKYSRINNLVSYISGNTVERIKEVVRILLSVSGSYGESEDEYIPDSRLWATLAEYLNFAIFDEPFYDWLFKKIQQAKSSKHVLFHHSNLQRALTNILTSVSDGIELSPKARIFYQDHVLANQLPAFVLQLAPEEQSELDSMNINSVRWGFIHAGASLLSHTGGEFKKLNPGELAEVGVVLYTSLQQGAVPQEYAEFFLLPAQIHFASGHHNTTLASAQTAKQMQKIFKQYFDHVFKWTIKSNPITLLSHLIKKWKTRPQLASEVLTANGIPQSFLSTYLNQHQETKFRYGDDRLFTAPNPDTLFDTQNRKIAAAAYDADRLLLSGALNALPESVQEYILNSTINRVTAEFSATEAIQRTPLHPSARKGISNSKALLYRVPDRYDLLQCKNNGKEHIYILETSENGGYQLYRAHSPRAELIWLLDSRSKGGIDDEYKLKITVDSGLKSKTEPGSLLIEKLSRRHSEKLRQALQEKGYEKTSLEAAIGFFKGFIPFHTCIDESIKGNAEAAVPACIAEVLGMLPFVGMAAKTGLLFGSALARSATYSLTFSSRQATLTAMLKQAGRRFIDQFPDIAAEISPKVMQKLSISFLRDLDPGFELLTQGTLKGTQVLWDIVSGIPEKGKGLNILADALQKITGSKPSTANTKIYPLRTLYSKRHRRTLTFAETGTQNGEKIWVQYDSEKNQLVGMKYYIRGKNKLEPVQSWLAKRPQRIKTEGLGGKRTYANDGAVAGRGNKKKPQSRLTHESVLLPANQLPPVAGHAWFWNKRRKVTNQPYSAAPDGVSNTAIQPLSQFIPARPLSVVTIDEVNQALTDVVQRCLPNHTWHAYAGLTGDAPPHITWLRKRLRAHLKKSRRSFEKMADIMHSVDYENLMSDKVGQYFSGTLGTLRSDVVKEVSLRITDIMDNGLDFSKAAETAEYKNFIIVSTDLIPSPDNPQNYMTTLSDADIENIPFGATSSYDPEARIVIFADAFMESHAIKDKDNLSVSSKTKVTISEAINHETTHAASHAYDIFQAITPNKRSKRNGLQIREDFFSHLHEIEGGSIPSIFEYNGFNVFIDDLKQHQGIREKLEPSSIINAFKSDTMLVANALASDANFITRTMTVLLDKRPYNTKYRDKRDTTFELLPQSKSNSTSAANVDDDDIVQNLNAIILASVVSGLMNLNDEPAQDKNHIAPLLSVKKIKANGVTMDVQIYGDSENFESIYPELSQWTHHKNPLTLSAHDAMVKSLSSDEIATLTSWMEFADQRNVITKNNGTSTRLNDKLINRMELTPAEQQLYNNSMSVINSNKLTGISGDYLRTIHYKADQDNPWFKDSVELNTYVTTSKAFMGVCSDSQFAISEVMNAGKIENNIGSMVFFNIENGTHALPILQTQQSPANNNNEFLYPPESLFKIKRVIVSIPVATDAGHENALLYQAQRVGVVMTEVGAEEAAKVTKAKNIFDGTTIYLPI